MSGSELLNPFGNKKEGDGGALAQLERREEAEIMAMVAVAKRFPRDPREACDKITMAFARPTLAEESIYSYARGGQEISDLTIRAMEAIALAWGNIDSSWNEISRGVGDDGVPYSLVEAKAWDLETTTRKRIAFIVRHWRDTRNGGYKLKDERDIYELCANMAQRRVRACIGSLIPEDVKDLARQQADTTLATKVAVTPDTISQMLERFAAYGVTKEHIEKKIQRSVDTIAAAQMVRMKKIHRALVDGVGRASDYFEDIPEGNGPQAKTSDDVMKRSQRQQQGAAEPAPPPPDDEAPGAAPAPSTAPAPQGDLLDGGGNIKAPAPEELEKKLKGAKTIEAAEIHAAWISKEAYPDDAVRLRLGELAEKRIKELRK